MGIYWELFLTFLKIGGVTFGGGYAMIALIEQICVERKAWLTHEEMMELTVLAESTPGPIAINSATYVGWKQAGIPGALAATLGMVVPSFCVILLIASVFDRFMEFPVVEHAFRGIRIGVGVLIVTTGWNMAKKRKWDWFSRFLTGGTFLLMLAVNLFSLPVSSVAVLAGVAGISLAMLRIREWRKRGGEA